MKFSNFRNVIEPMVLSVVGNKVDLEHMRAVSREEAQLYTNSIGGRYFETSAINDSESIEQVIISTARGLIRLTHDKLCSSIKRYESSDSILSLNEVNEMNAKTLHLGIAVDSNVEANDTGRLETPPWSIGHIAHGDPHRSGWCCY